MTAIAPFRRSTFAVPINAFAAAGSLAAMTARASSMHRRALQIDRAANCKPRIDRSSARPESIAS
ncbi:hypothetical protein [Burkholderia stagnalis]|uniref:hypothetical protein n=1 Tax=Burkholderia stagnalis TaxID=1503054 RepID=UPI0018C4A0B7|nr:hypothetical protein [Burkholderia stagnalis]